MKYRLKNRGLQRQLDDMSEGDFSIRLDETIECYKKFGFSGLPPSFTVDYGEDLSKDLECIFRRHSVTVYRDEIEEDEE